MFPSEETMQTYGMIHWAELKLGDHFAPMQKKIMAAALHAQIGFPRSDQSQSSTPGQTTNGGPVLRYFYVKQFKAKKMGAEVLILPKS